MSHFLFSSVIFVLTWDIFCATFEIRLQPQFNIVYKMSKKQQVSVRELDKERMRSLLRYGDVGRIAVKTPYHYEYVSRVIRDLRDNDRIWSEVAEYLNRLPRIELNCRLGRELKEAV